ncbi:MAG TPA: DNA-binding domain-containing protein [Alphaproteobacteria bacterium]|nr:DNA-binding domain-containing protein [Alphaproteobacteria bacterium]
MLKLREIQSGVRLAMLGQTRPEIIAAILGEEAEARSRLQIHGHHILLSLTEALKANFPVVCRVVDPRFFGYMADAFIRAHPPITPCLCEYGAQFPDFVRNFEPVRHLRYLGDLARLEWAVLQARNAPEAAPIAAESLLQVPVTLYPAVILHLDPSLHLIRTLWAVEKIWAAHQGPDSQDQIDLGTTGSRLSIRRRGEKIEVETVSPATFAFLASLRQGRSLANAGTAGLAADPFFDMALALRRLMAEEAFVGFAVPPTRTVGVRQP